MTKRSVAPWLGALVATPALTVSVQPSAAGSLPVAAPQPAYVGAADRAALKAGLLSLSLDDKLAIAGDRLGADPFASSRSYGATVMRTNTNIPECQGAGGSKSSTAPRTNTDIPECHCPSAAGAAGAAGAGKMAPRTNTDIPECRGPAASARHCGATGGTAPRTNTDIPECHCPAAGKVSGATGGAAPRTNTDIPECHSPNAALKGNWDLAKCKKV